jgi:hypothetical protein
MVVIVRFELSDSERRALNHYCGESGMASHSDCHASLKMFALATLEDAHYDSLCAEERAKEIAEEDSK